MASMSSSPPARPGLPKSPGAIPSLATTLRGSFRLRSGSPEGSEPPTSVEAVDACVRGTSCRGRCWSFRNSNARELALRKLIIWNIITVDGYFEDVKHWDAPCYEQVWGPELEQFSIEEHRKG